MSTRTHTAYACCVPPPHAALHDSSEYTYAYVMHDDVSVNVHGTARAGCNTLHTPSDEFVSAVCADTGATVGKGMISDTDTDGVADGDGDTDGDSDVDTVVDSDGDVEADSVGVAD